MIYSLKGQIAETGADYIVLQCDRVAYFLHTTSLTIAQVGSEVGDVTFYTYLNVREDAMELFGFASKEEKEWFQLLITVSGVGPKAGLAILSTLTPDDLTLCILNEDTKSIGTAKGIGPKTAKRIVLELKDKVSKMDTGTGFGTTSQGVLSGNSGANTATGEAISALVSLGYSQLEAANALQGIEYNTPVDELIRIGLKNLSKQV